MFSNWRHLQKQSFAEQWKDKELYSFTLDGELYINYPYPTIGVVTLKTLMLDHKQTWQIYYKAQNGNLMKWVLTDEMPLSKDFAMAFVSAPF